MTNTAALAPGMYRVKITLRSGDYSLQEMNPAAILAAQARAGWMVEVLGESRVTIVEDETPAGALPAETIEEQTARLNAARTLAVSDDLIDLYQTLRYGLVHPLSNALSGAIVDGLQHIRHGRVDRAARVVDEVRAALRA